MLNKISGTLEYMRVLAIDPGFDRLGIAILEGDPSKPTYVWSECVEPQRGAPSARLFSVFDSVLNAIQTHSPDQLAIESLFFSTNVKTALRVAEARGAILAAAGKMGISVQEYSPQEVKLAVTGYGASDKKAVASMVGKLLVLPEKKRLDDELDALALGIAALTHRNF